MSRFGLRSSSDIFKLSEEHSNRKKMDKDSKMTLKRNCQKKRVVGLKKEVELNELCYKREENRPSVSIVCSLPLNRLTGFIEKLKTNNLSFGIQSQCGPKTSLNEEKIDEGINLGQKQSKGDACDNSGSNIQDFDDCNSILEESVRILCLYCDKKFTSNKMQLKHVEKFHIHQKNRRCSGRNSQMSTIIDGKKQREEPCSVILAKYPGCTYCKRSKTHQIEASAKDLNGLFVHFIDCHSDRYFGCQTCMQRFQNLGKLTQHMQTIHKDLSLLPDEGLKNKNIDLCISEKSDGEKISREKVKSTKTRYSKPQKNVTITSSSPEDSSPTKSNTIMGAEEPILSRLGLAQNRLPNNRKGVRSRKDSLLSESILKPDQPSVYTSAVKARNKSGKNAIRESGDAEVIFRMPTRTEMLSSSFDENFYREVISNVRNNLLYFLDGKLFDKVKSVISSNSTITAIKHQIPTIRSNLAESSVVLHESNSLETEIHAATSLATITAFPTLLTAEQYGGDAVISKIRRPHTKNSWKWKWDSVKKYKLINEGGKIVKKMKQPMLGLRDLSKLDMWTQLSMRQKHEMQQYIQNLDAKSHGNESFREERQRINEQLNYILDMRLLPHIILEQSEQAVIKIESDEFDVGLSYIRNSDDDRVANILNQSFIDNTFFSVLQLLPNQELQYHRKQLVLSGEWARPRCYLCMCCGAKFEKLKSLEEHKMFRHSHILSTHYEVVGRELLAGDSIRHLFIPNRALSYYGNDNYNTSNLLLRKFGWKKPDLQDTSRRIVGSIGDDDSSDSIPSTLNSSTINTYSVKHSTADECDTDTKTTLDINTGSPSNSMQSSNSLFATPLQLQTKCKDKGSISIKCSKCTRKCSGTLDLYRHMLDCSGDYIWSLAKKRKYRYYCGSKKRRSWNKHNYTELRKKQPKSSKPSTPPNDTEESVSSSKIKNPSRQRPSDGISYLNAVGRRPKIRKDAFLDIVERNKEKVITSNKSIVPRTNPIWEIIAKDLDVGVKASTVYAKVGSNTFGALDLLRGVTREYLGNSSSSGMQSNTAESIKKMLENLPPKRICKKIFPTLTKTKKSKFIAKHKMFSSQGRIRSTRTRQISKLSKAKTKFSNKTTKNKKGLHRKTDNILVKRKPKLISNTGLSLESNATLTTLSKHSEKKDIESLQNSSDKQSVYLDNNATVNAGKNLEDKYKAAMTPSKGHTLTEDKARTTKIAPELGILTTGSRVCDSLRSNKSDQLEHSQKNTVLEVLGNNEAQNNVQCIDNTTCNKKRSKKINDCIAMLTGKLEEKLKTEQHSLSRDGSCLETDVSKNKLANETKVPKRKAVSRKIIKIDNVTSQTTLAETRTVLDSTPISPVVMATMPCTPLIANTITPQIIPLSTTSMAITPPKATVQNNVNMNYIPNAMKINLLQGSDKFSQFKRHKTQFVTPNMDSAISVLPQIPLAPPNANTAILLPKQPTTKVADKINKLPPALPLPNPMKELVPPFPPLPLPLPLQNIQVNVSPIQPPLPPPPPPVLSVLSQSALLPAPVPLTPVVPVAPMAPIVPVAPTTPIVHVAPLFNSEPLNLSNSKNMKKHNPNELVCLPPYRSGIPARRQTICGFEAKNFILEDEPLDLSKKSNKDQASDAPAVVTLMPIIIKPIEPQNAHPVGINLPVSPYQDAVLNKQFYSNLELLKIPQVRNAGNTTTTSSETVFASSSPKCSSKKRNAGKNNNEITLKQIVTNNGKNANKETSSNKKDNAAKGKISQKMDDEVINHIDDAINSVINASLPDNDDEDSKQNKFNLNSNIVPQINPTPPSVNLIRIAPVEQITQMQTQSTSSDQHIISNLPLTFFNSQKNNEEITKNEDEIINTVKPLVFLPQKRYVRSKTLDCRPSILAVTPETVSDSMQHLPDEPVPVNNFTNGNVATTKSLTISANSVSSAIIENFTEALIDSPNKAVCKLKSGSCENPIEDCELAHCQKTNKDISVSNEISINAKKVLSPPRNSHNEVNNCVSPQVYASNEINPSIITEENMSNINNTSSGFHSSGQVDNTVEAKKKQRRRRKNELAAIVADQLLESFKIDKTRRDNLKKLENLAYEKSEDLFVTGMLLMSSTKRNVTSSKSDQSNNDGNLNKNSQDATRQKQDQSKTKSNKVRQKLNIALEPLNINNEPSEKPKVEEIVNKRSRKKQYRGKSKPLDNENISKLKSSLESFSIGIEKQLTELEQRNSVAITVSETKVLNTSPVSVRPSLLRPSILSANMESNVTDSRTPITESKSTISSRDPRLNKNIHKNEQNKPFEARACENEKPLNEIGDVEEDNYLTEIAKNVNEKIMSAENEEFMFVNDDFELANELQDDSNSKFYSRPPTSMSVRSAPNFNDDRSNFGSICDENTNTEVMDMDLEDELSVYTSYSQDVGRGRGRRRRRRRSILLKRRPKKRVNPDSPTEKFECTLCKKVFYSLNSLTKHNMTLAHVSKLSAQEYLLSKTLENSSTITPVDSTVKELQIYNPIEGTSTKIPTDGNNMQRITEVKDTEFNQTHFSNPEQIQNSISRREQGHTTKDKTTFNNSSRLNLNPDERLFFECCNILKGAETACITNADENIAGSSFEYNFKDKTSICVVQDSNLKSLRDETPKKRLTPDRVICKPTNSHHEFRSPALQSTVVNKHGPSITSRDQNSPNYSGVSQFSAVTNTTSRFKTKAAMKGYENTNVDLILCKELEAKTPVVCKLTELAEIALGNEKSNSPDFTNLSNQQEGSIFRQLTNREYLTSSVAVDNPKNCSDGNADRTKSNEAHSSTSSKTIMHNSKIKPSIGENSKTVCRKIVIPDRPFKNIGLEEKETITFQKPKTSVNLLTDDNSVSTTTYSDRDDFDFASLSCDEEPDPKIGNERNIKNTSDSSSSRATAKTFENKSLIMDRIFKNMGTKAKTTVKVQSIGIQKDPSPKADINQLFDELRGDCGTKVRPTENITKKTTNLESFDNMQSKQRQAPYQEKVIPPSRRPKETRKKSNVSAKSQKEITRLQSELGMSQEEIVKLINEGQRKSKRRCATNRPKKLVEMWSSDEYEEFLSTKDIIALIEEKEKQETRKKRKTASQISTSSNKNKDTETPKLITNRRKSVRCITDKEDNKSGNSPEIQKNECSKTNGTAKTQSNNVPTHSLESKGKHTRRTTSADNDIKHRNSISSELNHKSTINNKKRKVSKDNSDAVATKTLALNRDTKKASKIQNSQDCTVKDVPYKDDNPDNYISDKKQSNSRTRSNKDKKYSESKDTVNSIKTLNKKSSTSVVNKKHNNANNQSYKNRRKNQSSQSPPRRKRLASEKLYYWSSSSDEDFGKINSSCAQEFDNGEQYQKHGWIVGDSHKKLVTLLAIAKGNKKVDNSCSVKKNVGRKKNVC